jgi:hypothetical protein
VSEGLQLLGKVRTGVVENLLDVYHDSSHVIANFDADRAKRLFGRISGNQAMSGSCCSFGTVGRPRLSKKSSRAAGNKAQAR